MTAPDREAAAGIVERLKKPAPPFGMEEFDPTYDVRQEAATLITTLLSELERVGKERDELRKLLETATSFSNMWQCRAEKSEPLLAEAVRVCEPFAKRAGKLDGHWLDHETHWSPAYGSTEITIRDLRAARAFIDRAKESNHAV